MSSSHLSSLTAEGLRDLMKQAGYGVGMARRSADAPLLCSATGGLPFEMRLLSPLPGESEGCADLMLSAVFQVQGDLSLDLVNRWNASKRFARLHASQGHLVLAMDIIMLGGVSRENLVAQIEVWDRLIQQLLLYLRVAPREAAVVSDLASKPSLADAKPDASAA